MEERKTRKSVFGILKSSVHMLVQHRKIWHPFIFLGFIHLLCLEIMYFLPRPPLVVFFGPIVSRLWGEQFLHYPQNFLLIPKFSQWLQYVMYIFVSGFVVVWAIKILKRFNDGKSGDLKNTRKTALAQYPHIFVGALISLLLLVLLSKGYELVYQRAMQIRSQVGPFFMIKAVFVNGMPYFQLLISVITTTVFAYLFPILAIENMNVFKSIGLNFKVLFKSFWMTFMIVLFSTILFLPLLILRQSLANQNVFPEAVVLTTGISSIMIIIIDALIYTALTINYLLEKNQ